MTSTHITRQCIARKVPELCKAYTPGKTDQDINLRLSRLEHIVEVALPHYWRSATSGSLDDRQRSNSPGVDDDNRSQADDEDTNGGVYESGKWYGNTAFAYIAAPAVLSKVRPPIIWSLRVTLRSGTVGKCSGRQFERRSLRIWNACSIC